MNEQKINTHNHPKHRAPAVITLMMKKSVSEMEGLVLGHLERTEQPFPEASSGACFTGRVRATGNAGRMGLWSFRFGAQKGFATERVCLYPGSDNLFPWV